MNESVFGRLESEVRIYCREFDEVFSTARDAFIWTVDGKRYIDFLAGAGALNYGHNASPILAAVQSYLQSGGILHSLDLHTEAKRLFLEAFDETILRPRNLSYRMQFTGPTGTNAVEAALKVARLATGRRTILAFTNAFHGMTLGALAVTASAGPRRGLHLADDDVLRLPFEGYHGASVDSLAEIERMLADPSVVAEPPAGLIVESVQMEGGINVASAPFMRGLSDICQRLNIPLILDDVQAGCGRTGSFFSFESLGIQPDIICLSKSLGGIGMPFALVLIRPELDCWHPGQHTGTFRGNNLAFVAATAALDYWRMPDFEEQIWHKAGLVEARLDALSDRYAGVSRRGRGLLQGLMFAEPEHARAVSRRAFGAGVIAETCGPNDEVLKIMPPLTIEDAVLEEGLDIVEKAVDAVLEPSEGARIRA